MKYAKTKKCPKCSLVHPDDAEKCSCGHTWLLYGLKIAECSVCGNLTPILVKNMCPSCSIQEDLGKRIRENVKEDNKEEKIMDRFTGYCNRCLRYGDTVNGYCISCLAEQKEQLQNRVVTLEGKIEALETEQQRTLIDIAIDITSGDRRRDYGRPLINHLRIALEWSNYLGFTITADNVVWMMVGLKKARNANTPVRDNMVDTVGYELCLDDMYFQVVEIGWAVDYNHAMQVLAGQSRSEMTELLEYLEKLDE